MNFYFKFEPLEKFSNFLVLKKLVRFIGLTFMIVGSCMGFLAIKIHIDEKDALSWTPHGAYVQNAKIRTHIDDENGFKSYSVDVTYSYKWENVLYQGDQYRLHDNATSGFDENNEIVQELLDAKQRSEEYPIYVNPNNPAVSTIKNVVNSEAKIVATVFGVLFPIIGFLAFFFPNLFNRRMF